MADGVTIQRASQHAIEHGVSLTWILDELERRDFELTAPVLLMSYLNPLLAFGYDALAARAADVGVCGFIVPDLPYEESAPLEGGARAARPRARANGHAGDAAGTRASGSAPRARASSTP